MKKIITIFVAFAIALSSLALGSNPAYACSCMMPKPPQEALADSAAVFQGTVTRIDEAAKIDGFSTGFVATFNVEKNWKGITTPVVNISTARDSAACGVAFEKGKSYVVYAYTNEDGSLATGLCSRTHEFMVGDEDVLALGSVVPVNSATTYPYRALVLTIGTVIVIGAAFVMARKKI